ncbi:MAG: peptide-methionine (S)-S-oxide reductase, partial [Nitrospira sp.]|nr:peptide-methionine (S)-S-oxide reductase [Nitrospira sp.]
MISRHWVTSIAVVLCLFTRVTLSSGGNAATTAPAKAYFAGGCFWCMEEAFEKVEGVVSVISGYTGGQLANPTYEEVSAGGTGH